MLTAHRLLHIGYQILQSAVCESCTHFAEGRSVISEFGNNDRTSTSHSRALGLHDYLAFPAKAGNGTIVTRPRRVLQAHTLSSRPLRLDLFNLKAATSPPNTSPSHRSLWGPPNASALYTSGNQPSIPFLGVFLTYLSPTRASP